MKVTLKKIEKTLNQFPLLNFTEYTNLKLNFLDCANYEEPVNFLEDSNGIRIYLHDYGVEVKHLKSRTIIRFRDFKTFPAIMCSIFVVVKDYIEWIEENTDPYSF